MKSSLPAPLAEFRSRLTQAGFQEEDLLPAGGPMGSEQLLERRDGLIFELAADRSFWYVAAGIGGGGTPETYPLEAWQLVLDKVTDSAGRQLARSDEEENAQLQRDVDWFWARLSRMQEMASPSSASRTLDLLEKASREFARRRYAPGSRK